jgi:hypothetical protein
MEEDMGTVRTNGNGQDTFYSVAGAASVQATGQEAGEQGSSIEQVAGAMAKAWEKKIEARTREIRRLAAAPEAGGPIFPAFMGAPPYLTWNVLLSGPFQALDGTPPSPVFAPQKIIEQDEYSFFCVAFWRNPDPPSYSNLTMAGHMVKYWGEVVNLSDVSNGPDLPTGPSFMLDSSVVTVKHIICPPGFFSGGTPDRPNLYEVTVTARVPSNPIYTAFSTWHFDPDGEIAMPELGIPAVGAGLQHDIPTRFLVYKKSSP